MNGVVPLRTRGFCAISRLVFKAGFLLGLIFSASATRIHAAILEVTSLADSGTGSLRATIAAASAGDTIIFRGALFEGPVPRTISLSSGALIINKNLTIVGPGDSAGTNVPMLALDGLGAGRILEIGSPVSISVSGLTLLRGSAARGGAVQIATGANVWFFACDFQNNTATGNDGGGAIFNQGTLRLDECLVTANGAPAGGGIASRGFLQITRSLFESNIAGGFGGGVFSSEADLSIESSTFSANRGGTGGGVAFLASGNPKRNASVIGATLEANRSNSQAGGLYVEGSGATATVGGSIFAHNIILSGGGSEIPRDLATQKSGKINSLDYNIVIKPGESLSPSAPNDQINIDPLLGPLAYNGGRTKTHAIAPGSPAIDRGNPTFAGVLVPTDQRGLPRAAPSPGGRADVGAYEYSGPSLTCPVEFTLECEGTQTIGHLTAELTVPGGGNATVTWTINGVAASPTSVNAPANGESIALEHTGLFIDGFNQASVRVAVAGFVLTCDTTVWVMDTVPPAITLTGSLSVSIECGTPYADPGATATDLCDGNIAVAIDATGVNSSMLGIYTVYYTAIDAAGNDANASRVVTVVDSIPPALAPVLPATVSFNATNPATCSSDPVNALGLTLNATDACDPAPAIVFEIDAGGSGFSVITFPRAFPIGTAMVYVSARDASGNQSARQGVPIVVNDRIPPTITLNGGAAVTLQLGEFFTDPGVIASDPCSGPVPVIRKVNDEVDGAVDSCAPGDYVISYTALDAEGNSASVSRLVTVEANIGLIAPATVERLVDPTQCSVPVDLADSDVVTVTGLPSACSDKVFLRVTILPLTGEPVVLTGLSVQDFPVGISEVLVEALYQPAVGSESVLAATEFDVVVSDPFGACLSNVAWPLAIDLDQQPGRSFKQMIARAGEPRWYKVSAPLGSRVKVLLKNLPVNFDLVVYTDIARAYQDLVDLLTGGGENNDLLAILGAEFAPEAFSPEAFSPEAFSPEAFSPEAFSPEAFSPEAFSAEAFSPEAFSPEAFSPEAFSPEAFSPEAFSPEAFSPEAFSPEAFSSAQSRSLLAYSAFPGTTSEGVGFTTYLSGGEFYIRVRGQNGVFSITDPFDLVVEIEQDLCSGVTDLRTDPGVTPTVAGEPLSLLVWDSSRVSGTPGEISALSSSLAAFAAAARGAVLDLAANDLIAALNAQADANPFCPIAKNLVAEAIRNLILAWRTAAPSIADITLIGPDQVIPFFRTNDEALLASEANYFPPVLDPTHSQSALRHAQVLTQDRFGSSCEVFLSTGPYFLPETPVGRLVESAAEIKAYLDTYKKLFDGTVSTGGLLPTPRSLLAVGYDFLADAALAVRAEFSAGLGAGATVNSLISPSDLPPVFGWTANQLRNAFLNGRHDISYLAGHFSTSGALAADYTTRFTAAELVASPVDLAYALVMSPGCHSGYTTIDGDAVPSVTEQPDWTQAFARKLVTLISGTGYQYGDTDFIEYTERLQVEIARALRRGTQPVSIGKALVDAKNRYLAETALMRGIHEKTLLQTTLYGLPMIKLFLPGARLPAVTPGGDVPSVTPVSGGPGAGFSLKVGQLAFTPNLTRINRTLDVVGTPDTVIASYYTGTDGFASIPAEPVRPLESFNVSRPLDGFVRGVGFRGGQYLELGGFIPYNGAPATETRGVHGRFLTDVFYPARPWNLNQIGEVCDAGGISVFTAFPTQFLSDGPEAITGTLRRYTQMSYSVFYCPEVSAVALSNPPAINVVSSSVSGDDVHFSVQVSATGAAGVQEVWVTYTGLPGSPYFGTWQSLTLDGPPDPAGIGAWTGTLSLPPGSDPAKVRFMVQAVNGIGAVALNTNFGRTFKAGTSTLDGVVVGNTPTQLVLSASNPTGGLYREFRTVQATLTNAVPLAGRLILFRIGPIAKSAITDASGVASATMLLNTRPDIYSLETSFAGDADHQGSAADASFTVFKMPTQLTLVSESIVSRPSSIEVELKASDGTPLKERTVVFKLTMGTTIIAVAEITDGIGRARLTRSSLAAGTFQVVAYFGQTVALPGGDAALDDPLYGPSTSASRTLTISTALQFGDEQAWINYSDQAAPGATSENRGHSSTEIAGNITSTDPQFDYRSILSSPDAKNVTAQIRAKLSGQTIATGTVRLRVQGSGGIHWHGDTTLNGSDVQLHVDWNGSGGTGSYHVWIDTPAGSGPLYNALPAVLSFELILGVGPNEHPTGGISEIGGPDKPWTSENPNSRMRTGI